jgi:AraC-like DNA-binding protein
VSLRLDPAFFEEIAATAAGTSRFRFPTSALGAGGAMSSFAAVLEAVPRGCDPIRIEEGVAGLATSVIARLSGVRRAPVRVSAQDERRLARVLALMDASATERLDLARLAGVAAMSKFHFLRVFRRVVGVTPHQHLVRLRLRHAAVKLLSTSDPVTHIALESGFGDLSGFNLAFRRQFNRTPTAFRRGGR